MQLHGYPYDAPAAAPFIVEMHDAVWRRAGSSRRRILAPGRERRRVDRGGRASSSPTCSTGTRCCANNSRWISFAHGPQRVLARTATSCCSATPRTPRTSPSAPAPSSPWRTRSRWPPACTSSPTWTTALAGVRGRAAAGGAVHPARGAGQPGVVREPRPVRAPGAAAVRLQPPHPQPPGHPRQPAAARPGVRRRRGRRGSPAAARPRPRARRRCSSPFRLRGLELRNRVVVSPMDMYSAADGVPADFHLVHLGSKALGGAGLVMTEMVCVSPTGRITPGCAGLYTDEQEAGLGPGRRLRARQPPAPRSASSSATPAARARPS